MSLYVNSVAPAAFEFTATAGTSGQDMSEVSAATIEVQRADNSTSSWSASLSGATTEQVTLTHTIAGGDLTVAGRYHAYASLTVPSGTLRTQTIPFTVKEEYQ